MKDSEINSSQKQPTSPYTRAETQDEARKLDKIARQFMSGKDEAGAFKAWHAEINDISDHGIDATRAVFKQMQSDNSGFSPALPRVDLIDGTKNGGNGFLQLEVFASFAEGIALLNYRDIGSVVAVDDKTVSSSADAGQNLLVGQRQLEAFTYRDND